VAKWIVAFRNFAPTLQKKCLQQEWQSNAFG
jgi:hypothetical protein